MKLLFQPQSSATPSSTLSILVGIFFWCKVMRCHMHQHPYSSSHRCSLQHCQFSLAVSIIYFLGSFSIFPQYFILSRWLEALLVCKLQVKMLLDGICLPNFACLPPFLIGEGKPVVYVLLPHPDTWHIHGQHVCRGCFPLWLQRGAAVAT